MDDKLLARHSLWRRRVFSWLLLFYVSLCEIALLALACPEQVKRVEGRETNRVRIIVMNVNLQILISVSPIPLFASFSRPENCGKLTQEA